MGATGFADPNGDSRDAPELALTLTRERGAQLVAGQALHADEQAAAVARPARPAVDVGVDLLPAAQVEVTNAKVRPFGDLQRFLQGGEQRFVYVVEYSWHCISRIHATFKS